MAGHCGQTSVFFNIRKSFSNIKKVRIYTIYAPFEKGGAYCVAHGGPSVSRSVRRSVGMSVSFNLVQLITQEGFDPEASNLVGR